MSWKREVASRIASALGDGARSEYGDTADQDRLRTDLEARGVAPELSEALCGRGAEIEARLRELDPTAYQAFLEGVVLTAQTRDETAEHLTNKLSELREIERLMGAFAGELSKLDEVLEVLAAHVARMRNTSPGPERVLH